jgi:hypothetical protein
MKKLLGLIVVMVTTRGLAGTSRWKWRRCAIGGLFTALLILGAAGASFANVIYNVDLSIGTGTVTGTITTDGATGPLALTDLKDWNLTITDGVTSVSLTGPSSGSNSSDFINGSPLSANATNILFDFSGSAVDNAYFFFEKGTSPNVDFVCFGPGGGGAFQGVCASGQNGNVEAFEINSGDNQSVLLSGTLPIATVAPAAVPEPSSLILLFVGVSVLLLMRVRSQKETVI